MIQQIFAARLSREGAICTAIFSEKSGQNSTKFGESSPIIGASRIYFGFQIQYVAPFRNIGDSKMDWDRKSRPNFGLFNPVKFRGGMGEMSESRLVLDLEVESNL